LTSLGEEGGPGGVNVIDGRFRRRVTAGLGEPTGAVSRVSFGPARPDPLRGSRRDAE